MTGSASVWLRRGFYAFVALLFAAALVGMFLTGPVVVRVRPLHVDIEASAERLAATVGRLCTGFAPRDAAHPANLVRAAFFIAGELDAAGFEVEIEDYELPEGRFHNVVATRSGTDPGSGAIVIGAHYDAAMGSPGARDNASGVAVLLELARTLPKTATKRTHYLVAFSTAEPPHFGGDGMGSYAFARRLQDRGTAVRLMLSLDRVGYRAGDPCPDSRSQLLRLLYPEAGDAIAIVGDADAGEAIERAKRGLMRGELDVRSFRAPRWTGLVDLSDHRSFRRLGFHAVQVTDTAFLCAPHDAAAGDIPDDLDYARMADVVRALHGVLWEGD